MPRAVMELGIELGEGGAQPVEVGRQLRVVGRAHRWRIEGSRPLPFAPLEGQHGIVPPHREREPGADELGDVQGDVRPELGAAELGGQLGELGHRGGAGGERIGVAVRSGELAGTHQIGSAPGGQAELRPLEAVEVGARRLPFVALGGELGSDHPGLGARRGETGGPGRFDHRIDPLDVAVVGGAGADAPLDVERRRRRPPAGTILGREEVARLGARARGAIVVLTEQRGPGDQHQGLGEVDVVALGAQPRRSLLGERQRLVRQAGGEERLAPIGEDGGTGEPQRLVRVLGLVEAAERLHQVAAPRREPGQVVAHIGGALRPPALDIEGEGVA